MRPIFILFAALGLVVFAYPRPTISATRSCIANLGLLHAATEQWAMDNKKGRDATPTMKDLVGRRYIKTEPKCPSGGKYRLGSVTRAPVCSVAGHDLALRLCVANLKQLDSAKEQWAMDNKKSTPAMPTMSDLVGPDKYVRREPTCPSGGKYSLGPIGKLPECSVKGHRLP